MADYKRYMKYGWFGALVGLGLVPLLGMISTLVSMIPGIELNLQAMKQAAVIQIQTTGLGSAVNVGLGEKVATYANKLLALSPVQITGIEWVWTAVGGALFFIIGAVVAEQFKLLNGSKVKQVAVIGVIAGIITGWIMSWSLSVPSFGVILTSILTWTILGWILVKLDESAKLNLMP